MYVLSKVSEKIEWTKNIIHDSTVNIEICIWRYINVYFTLEIYFIS